MFLPSACFSNFILCGWSGRDTSNIYSVFLHSVIVILLFFFFKLFLTWWILSVVSISKMLNNLLKLHSLVNTMSRCDCPILIEKCRSTFVQIGRCSPLSQWYLPWPSSKSCLCTTDNSWLRKHSLSTDCQHKKGRVDDWGMHWLPHTQRDARTQKPKEKKRWKRYNNKWKKILKTLRDTRVEFSLRKTENMYIREYILLGQCQ